MLRVRHGFCLGLLLLGAGTAEAFKIDTHLWLADHLLDEICSGQVVIDGRSIGLDPLVQQSITRFPDAYRIGVLGADLYPDLIAGQMTTHPGLPPLLKVEPGRVAPNVASMAANFDRPITGSVRGWQTDDWLQLVRDRAFGAGKPSAEIAFALGYMLHAAMDTWAHSYVNVYTGDLFSIVDNQEIAARHTAIETFIKQAHAVYVQPASSSRAGCEQPAERGKVRSGGDNLSHHAAPTRFVRQTLILNPAAANQYARTPGAQHVFAMWLVWDLARRSRDQWQPLRGQLDGLVQQASAAVLEADQAWQLADQAKGLAEEAAALALTAQQGANAFAVQQGQSLAGIVADVLAALADNAGIQATRETLEQYLNLLPQPLRAAYVQARNAALNADKALSEAVAAYEQAAQHSGAAAADALARFEDLELRQMARQAADQARQVAWAGVDTGLDGWRRNIEAGVDAYILAFEETGREIMRGSGNRFRKGAQVTAPLQQWAACWGPLFGMPAMPLPPNLAAEACATGLSAYNEARENLTLLKNNAAFDLLGLGHLKAPLVEFEERLHERVRDGMPAAGQLINQTLGGGAAEIPGTASFLAVLWDKHIEPQDLNTQFADDSSGQNLPVYPAEGPGAVTGLLHRDGLPPGTGNGLPAMLAFVPIANALDMSRLTLLNGAGLNAVAQGLGVTQSGYPDGAPAYPADAAPGAALIGAIRSIDGNHQWQPVAPPLPRAVWGGSGVNLADGECRRFGYPSGGSYGPGACAKDQAMASSGDGGWLNAKHGFRFWLDPVLRQQVFYRIFDGPLSVAVCERLGAGPMFVAVGCGGGEPYPPSAESQDLVQGFVNAANARLAGGSGRAVVADPARRAEPVQRMNPALPATGSSGAAPGSAKTPTADKASATGRTPATDKMSASDKSSTTDKSSASDKSSNARSASRTSSSRTAAPVNDPRDPRNPERR